MATKQVYNLALDTQISTMSRCMEEDLFALGGKNLLKIYSLTPDNTFEQKKVLKASKTKTRTGTTDIAWNPKEKNIIASTTLFNPQIFLWDIEKINLATLSLKLGSHSLLINRISWNPIKPYLLASCSHDKFLKVWNTKNAVSKDKEQVPTPEISIESKEKIRDCQFSPNDENLLLTSCVNGSINLWDLRSYKFPVKTYLQHSDDVLTIDWHPNQRNVFCSGGMDKTIYLWDINQDNPFQSYRTSNGTARMKWFVANPQYIISSYQTNNVYTSMWNINIDDIPEYKFIGHKDVVTCFYWDKSNTKLITCAKNGTILVTKIDEGLRFFDNISTSIIKFAKGNELIHYHEAKPIKKPLNDCDISKLTNDNTNQKTNKTGLFEIYRLNPKDVVVQKNQTASHIKVRLNKNHFFTLTPQIQEIYTYDKEQIEEIFEGYSFVLFSTDFFKDNRHNFNSEMTYIDRLKIVIEYNLNYALNHVKNYNHVHMWKVLFFLISQEGFKNVNTSDSSSCNNGSSILIEMDSLFLEVIRQNILQMINYLIANKNDIILAKMICFLFFSILERDEKAKTNLIRLEKDCVNYLRELKLYKLSAILTKFGVKEIRKTQENSKFFLSCRNCGATYDRTHRGECFSCKRKNLCNTCSEQVSGLISWCSGCGHGGHPQHMEGWFSDNSSCPSGCGHKCNG